MQLYENILLYFTYNIGNKSLSLYFQVAGLSRRIERIQELSKSLENKKGKLFPVKCDVTKLEEVQKSFKWVKDNVGPVQILINNAGLVKLGTVIGKYL